MPGARVAGGAAGTVVGTVATTQRPRSGSTKRAPAKRKPPPPSLLDRLVRSLAAAVDGHAGDVVGLVLLGVGLVAGLGVYAGAAGPVGRALDDAIGTLI